MKRALVIAAAVAGAAVGVWVWKRRGSSHAVAEASAQWAQAFSGAMDAAADEVRSAAQVTSSAADAAARAVSQAAQVAAAQVDDLATATKRTVADLAATAGDAAEAAAEAADGDAVSREEGDWGEDGEYACSEEGPCAQGTWRQQRVGCLNATARGAHLHAPGAIGILPAGPGPCLHWLRRCWRGCSLGGRADPGHLLA